MAKSTDEWPVHIMESQDAPPQKHWWWHIRIEYRKCKDQIWSAFSSYWACMNGLCLNTKASIPTRTLKVENSELTQKVLNLTGSGESIRPDSARLIYLPDLVSCRLNQTQVSQDKSKLVFKVSCIWRGDMDRTRFNQSFLIFFFKLHNRLVQWQTQDFHLGGAGNNQVKRSQILQVRLLLRCNTYVHPWVKWPG